MYLNDVAEDAEPKFTDHADSAHISIFVFPLFQGS